MAVHKEEVLLIDIYNNVDAVKNKIRVAAEKNNRKNEDIKIVAVGKSVEINKILAAVNAGIYDIGENTAQELSQKYYEIDVELNWHYIGHLQRNKVKHVIDKVSLIHSLDRMSLASEINKRAEKIGKEINVLVQVNVGEEESKFGLSLKEIEPFIFEVAGFPFIKVKGLMTIAPYFNNSEMARPYFAKLKSFMDDMSTRNFPESVEMKYLSMGMTNDYEVAVEEGANIVRIGRAIFGL